MVCSCGFEPNDCDIWCRHEEQPTLPLCGGYITTPEEHWDLIGLRVHEWLRDLKGNRASYSETVERIMRLVGYMYNRNHRE